MRKAERSRRLGRLVDELRAQKRQPRLPGVVTAICEPLPAAEAPGELRVLELRTCAYVQARGADGAWVSVRRFEDPERAADYLQGLRVLGRGRA